MTILLRRVGPLGLASLALIGATALFHVVFLEPMESRLQSLEATAHESRRTAQVTPVTSAAAQLDRFYRYFDRTVAAHERLAQLHAIAQAAGLQLPSADYQLLPTGTRLKRYQLKLPLSATYGQARAFMANALNEIPVLSVDQASFRRTRANDPRLEVEIVMTLHLLEP